MKKSNKTIMHIDLNAFYASCSIIKDPYLKNRVFVVGSPSGYTSGGVITTASYKARKYGIRSAMTVSDALKRYKNLLVVPADFKLYREKSDLFINILKSYTNLLEQASIDEAYVDITELVKDKDPVIFAKEVQNKLYKNEKLPSSIGIAPTLFLAKMASDLKKPLGITKIDYDNIKDIILPLSVKEIFGIGIKTYPSLIENNILTIKDFIDLKNFDVITRFIKSNTYYEIRNNILGYGNNKVDPTRYQIPKSISSETTFNYDVLGEEAILEELKVQLKDCFIRLKKHDMLTKTVGFKFKLDNFQTLTRSITLNKYTDDELLITDTLESLFLENYNDYTVRLIGATLSNLILKEDHKEPYNLFTYQKKND